MDGCKQINRIQSGAFQHRYMEDGLLAEIWESLFRSCSSIMSTFSNTRKRKHENDVKCEMTQTYEKARIEAEYHIVGTSGESTLFEHLAKESLAN